IWFGVGRSGTAGYLISRAAEQPAILSLTAAIVGVRFFGLARPLVRYLERLPPHHVSLRSLRAARAGRAGRGVRGERAAGAGPTRGHPARRPPVALRRRRRLAPEPLPARPR